MKLTLPWGCLCSDNRRVGGMVGKLTKRYRTGKEAAHVCAMLQVKDKLEGDVKVSLTFYPPDKRRRDTSNLEKLIFDALEGVCYTDDNQITIHTNIREKPDRENPRVEIEIEEVT